MACLMLPSLAIANGDQKIRLATEELVKSGNADKAMQILNQSQEEHPNFRLSTFLQAELFSAMAGGQIANKSKSEVYGGEAPQNLLEELKLRYSVPANLENLRPAQILKMPTNADVLLVDASNSRAYLLKNKDGDPVWDKDYYVTIGKLGVGKQKEGDLKTPLGVYTITEQVPKKYLRSLFGAGALQLNFPNALDQQMEITGSGIWVHGVPKNTYSRAPKASDGCLAFSNDDIQEIIELSNNRKVHVAVSSSVQWLNKMDWDARVMKVSREITALKPPNLKPARIKAPLAIYAPESLSSLVIDRGISHGEGVRLYREYWDKNGNTWTLKVKSRT
jgi:hypothetical protein